MKKELVLFNEKDVRIEKVEGQLVVSSRIIAEQLGKEHRNVVRDLEKILTTSNLRELAIPSTYEVEGQTRKYKHYLLTEKGLSIYLTSLNNLKNKIPEWMQEFAKMNCIHTYTRFENSFLVMIEEALLEYDNMQGIKQYGVGNYKVDFYIPSLNIAIEYDEEHHLSKIEEDERREAFIKNELNCKFIRVNYKNSDIVNVIKIIKLIEVEREGK